MALLTIWAYLRKRRRARRILREWEEEEDQHLPRLFVWDEVESTASPLDEGDEEH